MAGKRRGRRNPFLAVLNPRGGAPIGAGVMEVVYNRHATHGRGPWVHKFTTRDATVSGRKDGSVVIRSKSGRPLWSRDGRAGWLDNPKGKRLTWDRRPHIGPHGSRHGESDFAPSAAIAGKDYRIDFIARRRGKSWKPTYVVHAPQRYGGVYEIGTSSTLSGAKARAERHERSLGEPRSNPKGGKMAKRTKSKRKPPRGFKTWKAYMRSIRPGAKKRRRRSTARASGTTRSPVMARKKKSRRRRNPGAGIARRRGRRSRRGFFRRNPGGAVRGIVPLLMEGAKGGAISTVGRIVSRGVPALVGIQPNGYLGLGVQAAAGGIAGVLVDRLLGRGVAVPFLIGVFGNVTDSLVRGLNIPFASPALGDETELHAIAGYVHGYVPRLPRTNDVGGPGGKPAGMGESEFAFN